MVTFHAESSILGGGGGGGGNRTIFDKYIAGLVVNYGISNTIVLEIP